MKRHKKKRANIEELHSTPTLLWMLKAKDKFRLKGDVGKTASRSALRTERQKNHRESDNKTYDKKIETWSLYTTDAGYVMNTFDCWNCQVF